MYAWNQGLTYALQQQIMGAHISDGNHQLDGVIIVQQQLAQRQAVVQLCSVLVAVAPQVLLYRLQALHI